jgi:hypothetical protein
LQENESKARRVGILVLEFVHGIQLRQPHVKLMASESGIDTGARLAGDSNDKVKKHPLSESNKKEPTWLEARTRWGFRLGAKVNRDQAVAAPQGHALEESTVKGDRRFRSTVDMVEQSFRKDESCRGGGVR